VRDAGPRVARHEPYNALVTKSAGVALLLSVLLLGVAGWLRFDFQQKRDLSYGAWRKLVEEQPQVFVPETLHLTGWIEGDIDRDALLETGVDLPALTHAAPPQVSYIVRTYRGENSYARNMLRPKGIRYSEGFLGARFYYRTFFVLGLLCMVGAILIPMLTRHAQPVKAEDRTWWFRWRCTMLAGVALLVLAPFVWAIELSLWHMLLPMVGAGALVAAGSVVLIQGSIAGLRRRMDRSAPAP
jgi:hypothetical protein